MPSAKIVGSNAKRETDTYGQRLLISYGITLSLVPQHHNDKSYDYRQRADYSGCPMDHNVIIW